MVSWSPSESFSAPSGLHLAAKAARKPNLGGSWDALGALWRLLGSSWSLVGRSWGRLGRSWASGGPLFGGLLGLFWWITSRNADKHETS